MSTPLLADAVARTLIRDLGTLADEIQAYPDDETLWTTAPGTRNSGGVLANHLTGNLLHYVGGLLGDTGYVRDRQEEFGARDLPREQLLSRIQRTRAVVDEVVRSLSEADLEAPFPDPPRRMDGIRTGPFLLHLVSHLGYHLGQVNYHRRMLEGREETAGK
jgi:uncharacterized damage-inducible protein DinB